MSVLLCGDVVVVLLVGVYLCHSTVENSVLLFCQEENS